MSRMSAYRNQTNIHHERVNKNDSIVQTQKQLWCLRVKTVPAWFRSYCRAVLQVTRFSIPAVKNKPGQYNPSLAIRRFNPARICSLASVFATIILTELFKLTEIYRLCTFRIASNRIPNSSRKLIVLITFSVAVLINIVLSVLLEFRILTGRLFMIVTVIHYAPVRYSLKQ